MSDIASATLATTRAHTHAHAFATYHSQFTLNKTLRQSLITGRPRGHTARPQSRRFWPRRRTRARSGAAWVGSGLGTRLRRRLSCCGRTRTVAGCCVQHGDAVFARRNSSCGFKGRGSINSIPRHSASTVAAFVCGCCGCCGCCGRAAPVGLRCLELLGVSGSMLGTRRGRLRCGGGFCCGFDRGLSALVCVVPSGEQLLALLHQGL